MSGNILNRRKHFESEVDVKEMIIIDNGTVKIKIGRSGVDYPSVIIDTVSGYPHAISDNDASPPKKIYFGKELVGKLQKFWTISSRIRLIFGIVP
jgi:actin-related protein